MDFKEALVFMKRGIFVKRPEWQGYWEWDDKKRTIMMHCKADQSDTGNPVLDIRETDRVEFTLRNILVDDFIFANPENCPVLRAELEKADIKLDMDFSDALKVMKSGKRVARRKWCNSIDIRLMRDEKRAVIIADVSQINESVWYNVNADDILATDWYIVE